jgi:hypothetical protein
MYLPSVLSLLVFLPEWRTRMPSGTHSGDALLGRMLLVGIGCWELEWFHEQKEAADIECSG